MPKPRLDFVWLLANLAVGVLVVITLTTRTGVTIENYQKIKLGMTLPEVEAILGDQHEPMTPWVTVYWVIWVTEDGTGKVQIAAVMDRPEIGHGKVIGKWVRTIKPDLMGISDIRLLYREGEGY
ncbi:MAG TPA: hypothetical protein PLN21_22630 [Gemmatales bacterium]|nr:hypothetical protein [Gemmatales bacterium]